MTKCIVEISKDLTTALDGTASTPAGSPRFLHQPVAASRDGGASSEARDPSRRIEKILTEMS